MSFEQVDRRLVKGMEPIGSGASGSSPRVKMSAWA